MANSISLTGKNSFVATDTSINKELFNFSINLNNSITSEAVLSGEVNLVNDTPVVINQKNSWYWSLYLCRSSRRP